MEMNIKPLRTALFILLIPLFLGGCSGKKEDVEKIPSGTPSVLPNTLEIKRLSKTYVITGIGLSGSNKVAIINNQVVIPGEEIGQGVLLQDVHPTYATILFENSEYQLRPETIQNELDQKNLNPENKEEQ